MEKEKDLVLEKELNNYILSKLNNVQDMMNSGTTIDIDEFIKLIFKFLDSEFDIYPEVQNLSNSLVQQLVNNHIQDISENMVILSIWYTLNRLSSNENVDQIDELFFEIYVNMKDQKVFGSLFDKFQIMLKHRSLKECINYLIKYNQGKPVDLTFIHKLAYTMIFTKQMGEEFSGLYDILYEYFSQALKDKNDDLVFYLYYPLLLSHNTLDLSQENFKKFNNNIEKKLESYIKDIMIPKYSIAPTRQTNSKKRIALMIDRLTGSSINKVFNRLLEVLTIQNHDYEIYVYNLNWYEGFGTEQDEEEIVKAFGFKYIDCHKEFCNDNDPIYSLVDKSIKIREHIISEDIDILIMPNGRPEFNFLFTTRTAPSQIYWSHGNFMYNLEKIDKKISHSEEDNLYNFNFFTVFSGVIDCNSKIDELKAQKVREKYSKDSYILGSIGRLVKIDNEEYISAIAKILESNPNTIFLACGPGETENIKKKIKQYGIENRFYCTGHIDPHVYAHVIDLYLDPFPHGGGEALEEYRGKGKPYVSLVSQEFYRKRNNDILEHKRLNKLQDILNPSLYNEKYLETLDMESYLIEENKQAKVYTNISLVVNIESYINIATKFIQDTELCKLTGEEQMYFMYELRQTSQSVEQFIKAIND